MTFMMGILRIALAVAVALLLIVPQNPFGQTGAYLAVGITLIFGIFLALGWPKLLPREGLAGILADALTITLLVGSTGGERSLFYPFYLLAALGIVRVRGGARIAVGIAALVLAYLVGVAAPVQSFEALLSPAVALGTGLIALFCGFAAFGGASLRSLREEGRRSFSDLAAERRYAEEVGSLVSRVGPVLAVLSAEEMLRWTAETVRETLGAPYAHVTTSNGTLHHTAVQGDKDVYPSWWHPEIQRLVLWSCRTGEIMRSDAAVHDMEGFVAVPAASEDGESLGAIVAGGRSFDAGDERALELLAPPVASALANAGEAPGGLDPVSGVPNQDSLNRVLRRQLSQDRPLTILMVHLGRFDHHVQDRGSAFRDSLLHGVGKRLVETHQRVFRCERSTFAVLSREPNSSKARAAALKIKQIVEEVAASSPVPVTASLGFVVAERGRGDPDLLLDAAHAALRRARSRPDRISEASTTGAGLLEGEALGSVEVADGVKATEVVQALEKAIEVRDPDLGEHSRAVSRISHLIGSRMSLPAEQMEPLVVGALLHDLGKIGLPDHILKKPAALSAEEYETVKLHPVLGARILASISELSSVVPVVRHHHERFDGGGYPDGLRGEDTLLIVRIVLIADAFDSMMRDRVYRPGRTMANAVGEIARNSGTQFDPEVVKVLREVMAEPDVRRISL